MIITKSFFIKPFILLLVATQLLTSCKGIAKKATKEVLETTTAKTAKSLSEEIGEKTLKDFTPEAIRHFKWDEVIVVLEKENPLMAKGLKSFSKRFRKGMVESVQADARVFNAVKSSPNLWDDYGTFVGDSKVLKTNPSYFVWFARSENTAIEIGGQNRLSRYLISDKAGHISILDRETSQRIARIQDGLVIIDDAFQGSTGHILPRNSILRDELFPHSVYRVRAEDGIEYLYNVDELGRISSVKAHQVSADEFSQNILFLRGRSDTYAGEGKGLVDEISGLSRGSDIDVRVTFQYADDGVSPAYVKVEGTIDDKPYARMMKMDNDRLSRRLLGSSEDIVAHREGREAMDYLTEVNPKVKKLLQQITEYPGTSADNFIVESTADGRLLVSHKGWPGSIMEVDGDHVRLKAGSVANTDQQALNQFLNTRMPNTTYEIDDYMELSTDGASRVSEARATYTKDGIIERSGQRDSHTQRRVIDSQDGIEGDQSGHVLQRALGGGNELGNQVPMSQDVNLSVFGAIERQERSMVDAGSTVSVYRKCIYEGNSKRPSYFIINDSADGVPLKVTINGKEYLCPIKVSNTSPAIIEQL